MTEAEWLMCGKPGPILKHLGQASERKLRHFMIACARSVLVSDPDAEIIDALAVAERFADGAATRGELTKARTALAASHPARLQKWPHRYLEHVRSVPAWHTTREGVVTGSRDVSACCAHGLTIRPDPEFAKQAGFLRDIFPFRPVDFSPTWRTSTALALAQEMYESRDFSAMPILTDALQEAGCDRADILDHCRGPLPSRPLSLAEPSERDEKSPHVRGCWVVDLVLGKE